MGLAVTDVTYAGSQPWPFPCSLMLGYTARGVGATELRLDDDEIADPGWFTRDELLATGRERAPCGSSACPHRCRSPGASATTGWPGCCPEPSPDRIGRQTHEVPPPPQIRHSRGEANRARERHCRVFTIRA